jgi:hypothetical protein
MKEGEHGQDVLHPTTITGTGWELWVYSTVQTVRVAPRVIQTTINDMTATAKIACQSAMPPQCFKFDD